MSKYKILLVDDEENILQALKRLLREMHIEILTALSGEEALEIIKKTKIQLLITDNLMPGMKGVDLIRSVRGISPETIRIILSGHSDLEAILKAVNDGEAYRFILKPWDDLEMKITVNIALGQYRLAEENKELLAKLRRKERILDELKTRRPELFTDIDIERPSAETRVKIG